VGESLEKGRFLRSFGKCLLYTAGMNPDVLLVWWRVSMLMAPETDLFTPWLVAKVFWNWRKGRDEGVDKTDNIPKFQH